MKINSLSLFLLLCPKNKKYFYFLFFFVSNIVLSQTTLTFTKTGTGFWSVPCDVTSITVEAWGAGGAGGGTTSNNAKGGGGGGGGAYVRSSIVVSPGTVINFSIGAGAAGATSTGASGGDTWFVNNTTILAKGGSGGLAPNGGNASGGATLTGSIGDFIGNGGNGGNGSSIVSGVGGTGGNFGGSGGAGGATNGNGGDGENGNSPGGGGGGAFVSNNTDRLGGNGGNGQIKISYTTKYCAKSFTTIEPITNVTFAGINNTTSGTVNGSASSEYFCAISASVLKGDSYSISLSGNTNGNYTDYFRVYIDWDQNGVFGNNLNEIYDIGTIANVTSGTVTGNITIPATALAGNTTMRVVKNRGGYSDTCTSSTNGQAEDYTVMVLEPTCTVASGGTAAASPTAGKPGSVFTVSVSGSSNNTVAYTYQWEKSPDNTNWSAVSGANTPTANIASEETETTYYYRRKITCVSSGISFYSSSITYTTAGTVTYCTPTFNTSNIGQMYIRSFRYIGVLNDEYLTTNISTQSGTNGEYENFTNITPIAEQVRGSILNVEAISTGTDTTSSGTPGWGRWMAWVDWNRDGTFSSSEVVYSLQDYSTGSVTFGFVIPSNQALGNYRIRISVMSNTSTNPCGLSTAYGEVEDYLFKVVEDNNAKLDTTKPNLFFRCGSGEVPMIVYGADANAVSFKWYDAKYGGNLLNNGSTYSPTLSTTTTYYVTAVDTNGKETPFRYPIIARIDPQPEVVFSPTPQTICGEDDPYLLLSVGGDSRQVVLLDEKFNTGLGAFVSVKEDSFVDTYNTPAYSPDWVMKPSPLVQKNPPHLAIASSIASGYFGGNFAIMNTDVSRNVSVKRHLVSTATYDTTPFLPNKIKLNFDLYYFSIALVEADGYIKVEYSLNGTTWSAIKTYVTNEGNPLIWNSVSLDLDALGVPRSSSLKIRFSVFSRGFGTSVGYYENVATLDNIKLYGDVPLDRDFDWSGLDNVVLYDKTCTTPLGSTLAREVCVKPPLDEFEKPYWTFSAHATFENGCPAFGTTVVYNDTKVWREPGIVDWNQGAQWKPSNVPDIKKCVIIRTPVELPTNTTGSNGLARSVIVKNGGSLMIKPKSSLTIQNYIKNETTASSVIVESDANLKQNSNTAINSGNITVHRSAQLKRLDYNYWGTPVTGQNVRDFSTNTLTNRFYVYREKDDFFDGVFAYSSYSGFTIADAFPLQSTATYNFEIGKGYAIRAPNDFPSTLTNFNGIFIGIPNNGIVNIPVVCSNCIVLPPAKGNNLISNPYPSNIDFEQVYTLNSGLIYNTYYVWTNTNYNPKMQGENYPGTGIINNYALYNSTGGLTAPYGFTGQGNNTPVTPVSPPNRYIKVGQGFIVKAKGNGTLTLNNSMRSTDNTANFFNRMSSNEPLIDRFWISLKTPLDFVSPILIGYKKGASNRYEMDYDAEHVVIGSDSFYSLLDDKKLAIQGRYPFQIEDSIPLGTNYYESGTHTINLDRAEGVFANGQNIYLKDNYTGVVTNLSQSPYTFTADAGEVNNRFEIIYNYKTLGSNEVNQKEPVVIYKEDNGFVINANEVITSVKLFDATGRLVNEQKVGAKSTKIHFSNTQKGVFLVEIITPSKRYTKKIIN